MWARVPSSYNGCMSTIGTPKGAPHFATGGLVLEALAAHDFGRLTSALEPDASMAALTPGGLQECEGSTQIRATFEGWFGDVDGFEVTDASMGSIGELLELRWCLRVRGAITGGDAMVVEQHVYAATARSGRIGHIRLLCSGFCKESVDA
jgi:hypothetical protein